MSMLPGRARKITDNAAVLAADDERLTAIVAADLDTLERLLRPEFVFVHADGAPHVDAVAQRVVISGGITMESTMSANTNTSGVSELTDGELDAVNGGIIVVCGQQVGALTQNIGSASSGAGAGKVSFNEFSITKKIDSASPKL